MRQRTRLNTAAAAVGVLVAISGCSAGGPSLLEEERELERMLEPATGYDEWLIPGTRDGVDNIGPDQPEAIGCKRGVIGTTDGEMYRVSIDARVDVTTAEGFMNDVIAGWHQLGYDVHDIGYDDEGIWEVGVGTGKTVANVAISGYQDETGAELALVQVYGATGCH